MWNRALLLIALAGCAQKNPLYCDATTPKVRATREGKRRMRRSLIRGPGVCDAQRRAFDPAHVPTGDALASQCAGFGAWPHASW